MVTLETVLFTSDVVDIFHDTDNHYVHIQWKRFADSNQFRKALEFGYDQVVEHNMTGWLGNLKHMESILPVDEEWAANVWIPKLAKTGVAKMAIVTSLDFFNNVAVKRIMQTADPVINFETRYFVDLQDARDWLSK